MSATDPREWICPQCNRQFMLLGTSAAPEICTDCRAALHNSTTLKRTLPILPTAGRATLRQDVSQSGKSTDSLPRKGLLARTAESYNIPIWAFYALPFAVPLSILDQRPTVSATPGFRPDRVGAATEAREPLGRDGTAGGGEKNGQHRLARSEHIQGKKRSTSPRFFAQHRRNGDSAGTSLARFQSSSIRVKETLSPRSTRRCQRAGVRNRCSGGLILPSHSTSDRQHPLDDYSAGKSA